jgi:fatty acid desaturase
MRVEPAALKQQVTSRGGRPPTLAIVITVTVLRSIGLFVLAALAEIGGAWLIWQACASTAA